MPGAPVSGPRSRAPFQCGQTLCRVSKYSDRSPVIRLCQPRPFQTPTPFDASWRQEAGDGLDADGLALIDQAVAWAEPRFEGQQALTGESLASHGAGVVRILAGMHTDAATRAAALLAACPPT